MLLEQKTAVIYTAVIYGGSGAVGGGSGAVGAAAARVFPREGARVHLVGRTEQTLRKTVEEIRAAGGDAEFAVLDAFDEAAVRAHADAGAAGGPVGGGVPAPGHRICPDEFRDREGRGTAHA